MKSPGDKKAKRVISFSVKILISGVLIAYVLNRIGIGNIVSELSLADPLMILLGLTFFSLGNLLGALQWGILLKTQSIELPPMKVLSLYLVGIFFNNFLISNMGGDVIRIYDVRKESGQGSGAFAATFVDRFIGLFSLTVLAFASYFLSPPFPGSRSILLLVSIVGLSIAVFVGFTFSRRLSRFIGFFITKLLPERFGVGVMRIRENMLVFRGQIKVIGLVLVISVAVQLLRVGVHYAAGLCLGNPIPSFRYFLIFIPLIAIAASVPISFGGIGVRENLGIVLFSRLGMGPGAAFSMEFLAYLISVAASSVGGMIFVFRKTKG